MGPYSLQTFEKEIYKLNSRKKLSPVRFDQNMIDNESKKYLYRYRGGGPKCTEENLDYFIIQLKQLNSSETKLTFRKWLNIMLNLIDLID